MGEHGSCVFMAGGTGYMGQRLITPLLGRGHEVRALVRTGSEKKLPGGLHGGSPRSRARATRERSLPLTRSCSWWEWHIQVLGRGATVPTGGSSIRIGSGGGGEDGGDSTFHSTLAWRIRRR